MQNLSPLHEAAEGADFPKFDPDPVGVAGGVAKIKVAYNLVILMGDSSGVHDWRLPRHVGSDDRTKKSDLFLCL